MNEPTQEELSLGDMNFLGLKEQYLSADIIDLINAEHDGTRWIFNFYRNIFELWCS